jgi:acyl CoA:acetate/3-ketoacid CoA transferase beta subunit
LVLVDLAPGVTVQGLRDRTEARFTVHENLIKQAA